MKLKDTILLIRVAEQKLVRFLEKVGYELVVVQDLAGAREAVDSTPVDAVVFDGIEEPDAANLLEFLKTQNKLATTPFFFIAEDSLQVRETKLKHLERVEIFEKPLSIGSVASKIATELRLRKFAGTDESTASVAEVNAALRDVTARLKKDIEDAQEIQKGLLPKSLPKDQRFEIAASYEPLEEVGGDWFYIQKTEDDRLSVQIADVTGHGLSAAFIGSMTKLALMAADEAVPHDLLRKMNDLMAPQMPDGKFVTMFSYLYDPATGKLDYARAGHPPGLLLKRASNEVLQLLGDGFAVGFFDEAEYTAEANQVDVGDVLVVYTDALPESQNMTGEYYGTERMEEFMKSLSPEASAADTISQLIEHFEDFRGGRILKDDVTIIALKRIE